jgi:hypothetical protein
MDAFEQLVSEIFWKEGYWVQRSVKVKLKPDEKRQVGRPTTARPELDVVAYSGRGNVPKVIECKSFINSRGVNWDSFNQPGRYKLFTDDTWRQVIFHRLQEDFAAFGLCCPDPTIKLCLAAGHIATDDDRNKLRAHFEAQGWELFDEAWIREHLHAMAKDGYENQVSAVVAKLLLPNPRRGQRTSSGDSAVSRSRPRDLETAVRRPE